MFARSTRAAKPCRREQGWGLQRRHSQPSPALLRSAVLQALSSVDSVMMMYPFFHRPQSLRLEEGWPLLPVEQYFQQLALQVGRGAERCHIPPVRGGKG